MAEKILIAHRLEHVLAALEIAAELHKPVILQSAPEAMFYAGPLYLKAMFEQAQAKFPQVQAVFILDGRKAGAEAIAAISAGHTHLRSEHAKIQDIARQHGVTVHSGPYEALDLQQVRDTKVVKQWLEKT